MRVTGYDDNGRGAPVEGAAVRLGPLELSTDAAGVARATLPPGRYGVVATKDGLVRSFRERVTRGVKRLAAFLTAAVLLAGCGFGQGEEREGSAELRITRDFGRETLDSARIDSVREDDTVMRFLRRESDIETSYGGRFVQQIGDLAGGGAGGTRDWFFWVNGLESSVGAAEYELSPGDRVQWDYRDWEATMRVPAIVGAYPEPFRSGIEGKRRPVRVECEDAGSDACETVKDRLRALGVAATGSSLGASGTENVIRVVVGNWSAVKLVQALAEIDEGPEASGVFARFTDDGGALELLGEDGRPVEAQQCCSGLIAATAPSEAEIVWAVTGLDDMGVLAAARSLDPSVLRGAFAVAITPGGTERLPLEAP